MFWINPTMVEETMRMVVNKEHFSVRIVNRDVTWRACAKVIRRWTLESFTIIVPSALALASVLETIVKHIVLIVESTISWASAAFLAAVKETRTTMISTIECLVIECRLFSKWHIGFLNWHYWTGRTSMYKSIFCYSSCHACNRSLFEWICITRACRWATVEFHFHGHVLDPAKPTPMLF